MIKIDQNYTDYRDDSDPKYPGGKAVNATTSEGTDGTPLLADWMNDINGALQAIFIEAFGNIDKVSGKPDNVQESDVLKAVKEIIKKLLPGLASQGYPSDANSTQGTGLVKTANRNPNEKECQQNEPWAASPNWVYNLLLGNAASEVNTAVTGALKERLGVNSLSKKAFQHRGGIVKADLDNTVVTGSYSVAASGYTGALLVFETHSSAGIIQFYKDGFSENHPWMCRNALDSDQRRWTEWSFIGVQLTVKEPNKAECQRNLPWAASPNWIYNLLLGNAASEVNTAVTGALKERLGVNSLSKKAFQHRGGIVKADLDNTVVTGSYSVAASGYTGALLVFETHSSAGIIQFYKDGFSENHPWMCRNALDSDQRRWTEWQRFETFENIAIKLFSQYTCAITGSEDYREKNAPPDIVGCRWVYVVRDVFGDIKNKYAFLSFWRLEVL